MNFSGWRITSQRIFQDLITIQFSYQLNIKLGDEEGINHSYLSIAIDICQGFIKEINIKSDIKLGNS